MLLTWREATEQALYGPAGFYRRAAGPGVHFRTSTHAGPVLGAAVARVVAELDDLLGRPDRIDVVDVGAGRGELLVAVAAAAPPSLRQRLALTAVEVAPRPLPLPPEICWTAELPGRITGLVVAHEWLDVVPVEVLARCGDRLHVVLVDPADGSERLGPPAADPLVRWARAWAPDLPDGGRVEVGRSRDEAWSEVVTRLTRGLALAVDYTTHVPCGTLRAYRDGRQVEVALDGRCDITACVVLTSCAQAGREAGATASILTSQRRALRALGVTGRTAAVQDAAALQHAAQAGELLDPAGLGGFGWLAQTVGVGMPPSLAGA